jgi:hypothetical protein
MIMRLRHANIRLINRRPKLPRLLLALPSKNSKSNNNKNNPTDAQGLTGHSISDSIVNGRCREEHQERMLWLGGVHASRR